MGSRGGSWLRLAALVAAFALVAAGCGGSDEEGVDGDSAAVERAAGPDSAPNEQATGPEAEIRALHSQFVDDVYAGEAKSACEALTKAARKRFAEGGSCEAEMRVKLDPEKLSENRPAIASLRLRGAKAVAQVKTKNSQKYPVPFAREDGQWKISGGFGP